ncbi:hypothetical protein G6732_03045 [Polynucleobacter paneuropaeus]|jgi:hypothetical protein|nr:hypothetical protein [Polynucleobacter paneuropaeus]QWD31568.1 hypothetical protein G6681_07520 [Polynucleobacter paneuropaeus]
MMINLYFGKPYGDWANEMVEEFSINHNLSTERASFTVVQELLRAFSDRSDGHSFLDDRFSWTYERLVQAPKITTRQETKNGIKYSVMRIAENYVLHKATGDRLPLTDRVITIFGEDFEDTFGIEYLGHKWEGRQKWLNLKQAALF